MNRDFFRRHTRFSHEYGPLERAHDPCGSGSFELPHPERLTEHRSSPVTLQEYGERRWYGERSAVVKPSGVLASTKGPAPDEAWAIATPVPMDTVKRKSGAK